MAIIYKTIGLAIYERSEWQRMTIADQNQARVDTPCIYVAPDGIRDALDTDSYPLTDLGNAELFAAAAGYDMHYDAARRTGYVYGLDSRNGCMVWRPDPDDIICKQAIDNYARKVSEMEQALDNRKASVDSEGKVKALRKVLISRAGAYAGAAAKRIIERLHTLTADASIVMDDVAHTGHLLNCPNGTLDLRTGQLRAPSKLDYITQGCPTEYHPGAMTADVDAWMDSICVTTDIRRQFLQILGVALDATICTKTLPMMYGSRTNNGKTTAVNAIMATIGRTEHGGYGQTISAGAWDKGTRTGGKCTPELATVAGARLVSMSEPSETQSVDWSYVKEVTGGGVLMVNPKNKPAYTIPATFTLLIDTNYLIRVDDPTLFRRGTMQVIPFLRAFGPADIDRTLGDRLAEKANREAILAAIVAGYNDYISSGKRFVDPVEAREILEKYETNNDRIGEFLAEKYVKVEGAKAPRTYVTVASMYAAYIAWLTDNGYRSQESSSSFRNKLESRARVEKRNNAYCVIGYRDKQAGKETTINGQDPLTWYMAHCMAQDPAQAVNLSTMVPAYARTVEALDVKPMDDMGVFAALVRAGYDVSVTGGTMTLTGWRMLTRQEMADRDAQEQQAKQAAHDANIRAALKQVEDDKLRIALALICDAYIAGDQQVSAALDLIVNGPTAGRLPF